MATPTWKPATVVNRATGQVYQMTHQEAASGKPLNVDWSKVPAAAGSAVNSATSVYSDPMSGMADYMAQVLGVARENSAFNAAEAQKQRDWSSRQAEILRDFNSQEAAKNRDWQKMMSDTAHQREISDLIAAGLNPVLSAMNGNGASVTSGATAYGSQPSGTSASADTSGSSAVASMLGSILTAQTRLLEMTTSAETQRAVADKYTAAQQIAALISADASKYGANMSSGASVYSADKHAESTRYSADSALRAALGAAGIHADASKYAADTQYKIHQDFPNTLFGALGSLISSIDPTSETSLNRAVDGIVSAITGSGSKSGTSSDYKLPSGARERLEAYLRGDSSHSGSGSSFR